MNILYEELIHEYYNRKQKTKSNRTYEQIRHLQALTVLEEVGNNDYIVDHEGVKCHTLFNWFVCEYYADDVYGRIEQ